MKKLFQQFTPLTDRSFIIKQYYQPKFTAPLHFHHGYELILIVKSYGKFYGENRVLNFEEDEVYMFGPGFAHCFYNEQSFIESGEMAHSIVIQFTEDFLGKDFFQKPELKKIRKLLDTAQTGIKILVPDQHINKLFFEIRDSQHMKSMMSLLELLDCLSEKRTSELMLIARHPEKAFSNSNDSQKIEAVIKYVMENFRDDVNSKEAAKLAYMNEAAFCRYFRRRTKKTFSQFVNDVRITHAIRLLIEKDIPVSQVCYESGFNNMSYFNRQFKLLMGKPPLEYRKDYYLEMDNADD
ncbi:helix-turn-helix domain-containing protein [Chitinophagaceae bacterium MMS25-I14]